jgi:hypothetical protein
MKTLSSIHKLLKPLFYILALTLVSSSAGAMSVSYQGSLGLMAWTEPSMTQYVINYSVTPWFAPAFEYFGLRGGTGNREYYFPQVGFLLKRWNNLESQANIYVNAGYGVEHRDGRTSGALNTELQADWESRKYYIDAELQAVRLVQDPYNFVRLRVGFAPYQAEFEQLHSWFIVQADRNTSGTGETTITPFVRLFYQNVLVEVGMSLKGEPAFNFMIHI